MSENPDLRPVREIYKNQDLEEVSDEAEDELYNRKWEIFNGCKIKPNISETSYSFFWVNTGGFDYDRTLTLKLNKIGKEICFDKKLKKYVTMDNSAYYLALKEFIKRQRIYPKTGWHESLDKSCCKYRFIVVKNEVGTKSRYVEYKTKLIHGWSPSKYIKISKDLKPKRKRKVIRQLVKSGATKRKIAKFFKLSERQVRHITEGIKQKKFKPETGIGC